MKRVAAWLFPSPVGRGCPGGAGEGAIRLDTRAQPRTLTPAPSPKEEGKSWLPGIRHSISIVLIACALTLSGAAFAVNAIDPLPFQNAAQRDRFQHLTRQLRCMVCQDESLLSSNADFARQLRGQIFDMMQEGKSDRQIKDWLVARYSTFILYDPPLAPATLALWFGTPAIFLAGGAVVFVLLRRRVRPAHAIAEEPGDDW